MIIRNQEEIYTLRISTIFFLNDNIVRIHFNQGSHIEWTDVMEIFRIIKKHSSSSNKLFALTIWGEDCTWEKEAREVIASDVFYENISAEAVILDSLAHKLIYNFTKQYYKPTRIMEIFSSEKEAMKWLVSLKEEKEKRQDQPATFW